MSAAREAPGLLRLLCQEAVAPQLGTGSKDRQVPVPVRVRDLPAAVAITAGENQTCALLGHCRLRCWGDNQFGQLGDGSDVNSSLPRIVHNLARSQQVTAGGSHTCALLAVGTVECWGYGFFGQLGDGRVANAKLPVPVVLKL
jgi:alpha-tubulin suppressor-like RCC1 family protein